MAANCKPDYNFLNHIKYQVQWKTIVIRGNMVLVYGLGYGKTIK